MSALSSFLRSSAGSCGGGRRRAVGVAAILALAVFAPVAAGNAPDDTALDGITSTPLPKRTAVDGPLFERVSPEDSGIDFVHRYVDDPEHVNVLANAMAGGGVAIGDVDGDDLPEIVLTRPAGGTRLYRNLGDFRFEDVTDAAGLGGEFWGTGPTFADVNGDGALDLHICGYREPNRLYVNNGDGTFVDRAPQLGLDFDGASIAMAFADYDLDGDLDGYLLTNRIIYPDVPDRAIPYEDGRMVVPEDLVEQFGVLVRPDGRDMMIAAGQTDRLYRNDRAAGFTDVTAAAGIAGNEYGLSATWWDYDDDGLPDLYVANDFWGADHLYRNRGDGTFVDVAPMALPHTPWFSMGSDAGDIDNDGDLDYIASDMASTTHYKRKANEGEMNEVGWFLETSWPRQYMRNALYLNTGTGRFQEIAWMAGVAGTDWTWATQFGDFDDDGWLDLFVSNGMTRSFFNNDLRRKASLVPETYMEDVWMAQPPLAESNLAFRNLGDLEFAPVAREWGLDHVGVTFGAALGDLDGDGDLDIAMNDYEGAAIVYRNRSATGRRIRVRLVGARGNRDGLGASVTVTTSAGRQKAFLGTSRGFMSSNEPRLHFGLGRNLTVGRLVVDWPSGHTQEFTDLAAGRSYTITEPDGPAPRREPPAVPAPLFAGSLGVRSVERPFDETARQPLLPFRLSQLGPSLAVADVDGDLDPDYYFGGPAGQAGRLFRNDRFSRFEPETQDAFDADAAREDMGAVFFDADGDDDLDLYVVSGGVECEPGDDVLADRLYLNDGTGAFAAAPPEALPDVRDSGGAVAAADFDRDGDVDLFVGGRSIPGDYPATPASRLLRNDGGAFVDVADEVAGGLARTGLVTSAVWSDADDDGWIDLFVTHEWGPVRLWRNAGGELVDMTDAAGLAERRGLWNSIAARDIDGDGDIDYAVGNLGLNSRYRASPEEPMLLFVGDFDGSGRRRLVEAEHEDGTLVPVRGRAATVHATPFLAGLFPDFESFARATLEDIYSAAALEEAERLQADTLESGVLINDGEARFTFRPLPRIVQASPAFGLALTDVNGDGFTDLYLVQNSFAPQRETGRLDGGMSQLLLGHPRGDGTLRPVGPRESGLLVPGDGQSLAPIDMDGNGWVDFLVGVNDDALRGFVNLGDSQRGSVSVRLVGPPGNRSAIGARVTVELLNGRSQTAEVAAGGGYLSQSEHLLHFGLGESERPALVVVRWPDGETTQHVATAAPIGSSLTIRR